MDITEIVFKTHDNENKVTVSSSETATPLAGVTRITAELLPAAITVDSDITPAAITWTDTVITFALGDVVASNLQSATVVAYSPAYTDGQVVIDPALSSSSLNFNFVD